MIQSADGTYDSPFCFNNRQPSGIVEPSRVRVALHGSRVRRLIPTAIHSMPLWGMDEKQVSVLVKLSSQLPGVFGGMSMVRPISVISRPRLV